MIFGAMFTGIIEACGEVVNSVLDKDILTLEIRSPISSALKVDQSIAHDGVCLTVVQVKNDIHAVQLVRETLERSHFHQIKTGDVINLERAMPAAGRFEGHIVQGHVDGMGEFVGIEDGLYTFRYPQPYAKYLVEKGSICVNGISLTVARLVPGMQVNLEFDILAKHLARIIELREL